MSAREREREGGEETEGKEEKKRGRKRDSVNCRNPTYLTFFCDLTRKNPRPIRGEIVTLFADENLLPHCVSSNILIKDSSRCICEIFDACVLRAQLLNMWISWISRVTDGEIWSDSWILGIWRRSWSSTILRTLKSRISRHFYLESWISSLALKIASLSFGSCILKPRVSIHWTIFNFTFSKSIRTWRFHRFVPYF